MEIVYVISQRSSIIQVPISHLFSGIYLLHSPNNVAFCQSEILKLWGVSWWGVDFTTSNIMAMMMYKQLQKLFLKID